MRGELAGDAFAGLAVSGLTVVDRRVRLLSAEPERVLSTLFGRGVEIADLEVVGADLEEAFLALTSAKAAAA